VSLFFVILVAGYEAGMYLGWVHEQNLTLVLYGQEYVTTIFSWTLCIMVVFVFCCLLYVFLMTIGIRQNLPPSPLSQTVEVMHSTWDRMQWGFVFFFCDAFKISDSHLAGGRPPPASCVIFFGRQCRETRFETSVDRCDFTEEWTFGGHCQKTDTV